MSFIRLETPTTLKYFLKCSFFNFQLVYKQHRKNLIQQQVEIFCPLLPQQEMFKSLLPTNFPLKVHLPGSNVQNQNNTKVIYCSLQLPFLGTNKTGVGVAFENSRTRTRFENAALSLQQWPRWPTCWFLDGFYCPTDSSCNLIINP